MSESQEEKAATTRTGGRLDGITQMKGTVTFATGGSVSIDFTVDGGSSEGTSLFQAVGTQGDTVSVNAVPKAASFASNKVTATRLPVAVTTSDYTVRVLYSLVGVTGKKKLTGTVAKSVIAIPGSVHPVTLK